MISNVILIGTILNERLLYLPSVFLLIYAALYLSRLRIAMPVLALLLVLAGLRHDHLRRAHGTIDTAFTSQACMSSRYQSGCMSYWEPR